MNSVLGIKSKKYLLLSIFLIFFVAFVYVTYFRIENVEEVSITQTNEALFLQIPAERDVITSPLTLQGKVRGSWLFEATAPVVLVDWDGKIISESYIQTSDDWMTTNFVDFTGELTFETPENIGDYSNKGTLIFRKNNPSGLPEHDDTLEIEVLFR